MKAFEINIDDLIANAAKIIAPVWPLQTFIARNPLHGIESLNFEDAIVMGEKFLAGSFDLLRDKSSDVNREMIKWCQAFLDEGQATITMPGREKGFYRAWVLLAPFDKKLRASQNKGWLRSLPDTPDEAISFSLRKLDVPDDQIEEFLKYAIAQLPGWAGYIKWRSDWQDKTAGFKNPITLKDFLAVRLAITCALQGEDKKELFKTENLSPKKLDPFLKEIEIKEDKYLQEILKKVIPETIKLNSKTEPLCRPDAQLVFCIDVRSEQFRMRIEREGNYETIGFAGFFGLPVTVHSYNTDVVSDCCPVLLKPRYKVCEEPACQDSDRISHRQAGHSVLEVLRGFYQDLKYNFATPFALVETLGMWCGLWMAIRTLMPTSSVKLRRLAKEWVMPTLATTPKIDIPLPDQIVYAESALRIMGLTKNFSRLVVFCGHGSSTENNPYASALDCGACGGNHGGTNGKILAAILNNSVIRASLAKKEIIIPEDTLFVGGEHNTTTDEVVIHGEAKSNHHREILERLRIDLANAGIANNKHRCRTFGLDKSGIESKNHVLKRSSDWAEVRPEWGLARNAAFIVGPRSITKDLDLDGRCFLHSYEWREDASGKSLETILTAPMVVAEWINTQYFFSTLNNIAYGSGSKITHNVTGKLGIMQGNGSDLMHGLPLQSVNSTDDKRYHELMRLQTIVYAPRYRIDSIIEKQAILKTLLFNKWVILVAIDPKDNKSYRLIREGEWVEITNQSPINSPCKDELKSKLNHKPYNNKTCLIATMHSKEKAIFPAFFDFLGLKIVQAKIDTDQMGTFTGEVQRKGDALTCVREKCELAMKESKFNIGIASEGSFGPHPFSPFLASDLEILYFIDQEKGFHLHQTLLSAKTNYCVEAISDHQRLKTFCDQALFPSHGLIVRPNQSQINTPIFKGIQSFDRLEEAFFKCCSLSADGKASVETDMRAHMNPTRMGVIKELADSFAKRLATPCPLCDNPGWGIVGNQKGLECQMCGSETDMVRTEVFGCPKCSHKEERPRQDGLTKAEPQYCGLCNP